MGLRIKFKIVTPERMVFEDEIDQATLPVTDGEVTILPNHQAYIASLQAGEIMLKKDGAEMLLSTAGGFVEFNQNEMIVLADAAERAEEIDLQQAEEARKRAAIAMQEKVSLDEAEYAAIVATMQREAARVKVARKHHSKQGININ
jgi:F-type H+-transporting ATPase subunit epsilon